MIRSSSGLMNEHLMHGVDIIFYVEGIDKTSSVDLMFWKKIIDKFVSLDKSFYVKYAGSKTDVVDIARCAYNDNIKSLYCFTDRDLDDSIGRNFVYDTLSYTFGRTYENDLITFGTFQFLCDIWCISELNYNEKLLLFEGNVLNELNKLKSLVKLEYLGHSASTSCWSQPSLRGIAYFRDGIISVDRNKLKTFASSIRMSGFTQALSTSTSLSGPRFAAKRLSQVAYWNAFRKYRFDKYKIKIVSDTLTIMVQAIKFFSFDTNYPYDLEGLNYYESVANKIKTWVS